MAIIPAILRTALEDTIDKISGDDVINPGVIRFNYGGYVWKVYVHKVKGTEIQIIIRRMKR